MDPRDKLNLDLDLARATGPQLEEQRTAVLACLDQPRDSDDQAAIASRARDISQAITAHNAARAAREEARRALGGAVVAATSPAAPQAPGQRQADADPEAEHFITSRALAHQFVQRAKGYNGGRTGIEVEGKRAAFLSASFPSENTRVPGILQASPDAPLSILDLIDRQTMTTQTLEWVQETTAPTAFAETTEGTAAPEVTWSVTLKNTAAAEIKGYTDIGRTALNDESQIRGYVEGRMTRGLLARLNGQILTGNGTAPNLRGILNTSGRGSYAQVASEDPLISIRKARTVAELSEFAPDAVVMNPVDWERVELSQDTNGQFRVISAVTSGAQPRVWGLAVISTTNVTGSTAGVGNGGTFVVGGFREGATLWEREGISLFVTDSDGSKFLSGIVTLLMSLRAALAVWRPLAFVEGQFDDLA